MYNPAMDFSAQFWRGLASVALGFAVLAGPARAAESEDPDWPCIQRLVPEVSAAAIWAGPPVEELSAEDRKQSETAALGQKIAARRTSIEEAKQAIESYGAALTDGKDLKLTALFAVALETVNRDRSGIMAGIRRYSRRQQALAQRIEQMTAEFYNLPAEGSETQAARRRQLQEQLLWDTRIYEEREKSLTFVCEQPVLLEQRIFTLAREIMMYLE
jgi:hypothetical protein